MSENLAKMAEQLDAGSAPSLCKLDQELAVKLILSKITNGINKRQEIYEGIKHVVPLNEVLGLGMLQMYYEWSVLVKESKALELLKIGKFQLLDGRDFIATRTDIKEISAEVQCLPLNVSSAEVVKYFSQFGQPIEVIHKYCEEVFKNI